MPPAPLGGEDLLTERVLAALAPHFRIEQQVWGTHPTGKRLRIDAVLRPASPDSWSRPDIALGVEFKAPTDRSEQRRDRKDNAKIISQCIDYSLTDWDGYGVQPVFFCPGFAEIRALENRDPLFDPEDYMEGFKHGIGYLMAAVMGQNNVGELAFSQHLGWAFLINGHHRIWSERLGPHPGGVGEGRLNKLRRTVGSR